LRGKCRDARSSPIASATIPSIHSVLFFLEGFQLSAASFSIEAFDVI
jgi:hypothetical protein